MATTDNALRVINIVGAPIKMTGLHGRRRIRTAVREINRDNILDVLAKALPTHKANVDEIKYLWDYRRGIQPVMGKTKTSREDVNHKVIINRAEEITSFKTGYLLGKPIQYTALDNTDDVLEQVSMLSRYIFYCNGASKDKRVAEWAYTCGVAYKMGLPNREGGESPFTITVPDPRMAFVVYSNSLDERPMMCVLTHTDEDGNTIYDCYTATRYYEITSGGSILESGVGMAILREEANGLGMLPVVEYNMNMARMGAFEIVIDILDTINDTESDRADAITQFVQSLMVLHNVDMDTESYDEMIARGAVKIRDTDPSTKGEITYITAVLNQAETQVYINDLYKSMLTVCGMPNRNDGAGDNGVAVIYRDGWSTAEGKALDDEAMYKESEREFIRLLAKICNSTAGMNLNVADIDIKFARGNYENIQSKVQVLDEMLNNDKIFPKLAFEYSGMFSDPDLAYKLSKEYHESLQTSTVSATEEEDNADQAVTDETDD